MGGDHGAQTAIAHRRRMRPSSQLSGTDRAWPYIATMPRMLEDIKAFRALIRHEDALYRNQQLDAAIKHKANCLKTFKQADRKATLSPRRALSG